MRVIVGVYACVCVIAYPMLEPDSAYWLALAPFSVRQFFFWKESQAFKAFFCVWTAHQRPWKWYAAGFEVNMPFLP